RGPRSENRRGQMDGDAGRPDLRLAIRTARGRGGLRLRRRQEEVRERLRRRLEQGDDAGPLRRPVASTTQHFEKEPSRNGGLFLWRGPRPSRQKKTVEY